MARLSKMAGALTAGEFKHAVSQFPRLSDKAKKVARAILVEGQTFEEVCQEFDTSRQLAHEWATKVFEAFRPSGWVTESVTLPPDQMEVVREMELAARQQWADELPPARIARR
jgi:transposase-like protein